MLSLNAMFAHPVPSKVIKTETNERQTKRKVKQEALQIMNQPIGVSNV
jgi:hypothetical protein